MDKRLSPIPPVIFHKMVFLLISLTIFSLLSALTYQRNAVWKNEYTLWKDVVTKAPGVFIPHINLGNAYIRRNAYELAEKEFRTALALNKYDLRAHSGLGAVYFRKRQLDEAAQVYTLITIGKPEFSPGHNNLGAVYMEKGLLDKAIEEFKEAIRLDPSSSDAYSNLGLAYRKKGLLNEAETEIRKALVLDPNNKSALTALNEVERSLRVQKTVR